MRWDQFNRKGLAIQLFEPLERKYFGMLRNLNESTLDEASVALTKPNLTVPSTNMNFHQLTMVEDYMYALVLCYTAISCIFCFTFISVFSCAKFQLLSLMFALMLIGI